MYAESMEDAKVVEMDNFMVAYNFRATEIYASAQYKIVAKSMDKARRPVALPDEADVTKLKDIMTFRLKTLTAETSLTSPNYSLLRSLLVSRLTLFNRRRAEEPARMLLSEWLGSASKAMWIMQKLCWQVWFGASRHRIHKDRERIGMWQQSTCNNSKI